MPRTDKYTGRLNVPGELSLTNAVNYDYTARIHYPGVRTLTQHTLLTAADSGKVIIVSNATNILAISLPPVNACNGLKFSFFNATANGFKIIGDTNAIVTSSGVNAADKFKSIYMNHTVNFGMTCDLICDASSYYFIPTPQMIANVGPGYLQG